LTFRRLPLRYGRSLTIVSVFVFLVSRFEIVVNYPSQPPSPSGSLRSPGSRLPASERLLFLSP
jgi:hypothetical protein